MQERYIRNIPSLTEEECLVLKERKVAVIGCGGLGGYIIEYLARTGIGKIVVADGDTFSESNLNRQLLSTEDNLGKSKAKEAEKRIKSINGDIEVTVYECFLTKENAEDIISGCDTVFDALDNIPARKILSGACDELNIPYIYGAIQGWSFQCGAISPKSGIIGLLFPEGTEISDKSVLCFTPAMCAGMQVSLGVKVLLGRDVEYSKVYYFDMLYNEMEIIDFS